MGHHRGRMLPCRPFHRLRPLRPGDRRTRRCPPVARRALRAGDAGKRLLLFSSVPKGAAGRPNGQSRPADAQSRRTRSGLGLSAAGAGHRPPPEQGGGDGAGGHRGASGALSRRRQRACSLRRDQTTSQGRSGRDPGLRKSGPSGSFAGEDLLSAGRHVPGSRRPGKGRADLRRAHHPIPALLRRAFPPRSFNSTRKTAVRRWSSRFTTGTPGRRPRPTPSSCSSASAAARSSRSS